jgi:hypothetical protein
MAEETEPPKVQNLGKSCLRAGTSLIPGVGLVWLAVDAGNAAVKAVKRRRSVQGQGDAPPSRGQVENASFGQETKIRLGRREIAIIGLMILGVIAFQQCSSGNRPYQPIGEPSFPSALVDSAPIVIPRVVRPDLQTLPPVTIDIPSVVEKKDRDLLFGALTKVAQGVKILAVRGGAVSLSSLERSQIPGVGIQTPGGLGVTPEQAASMVEALAKQYGTQFGLPGGKIDAGTIAQLMKWGMGGQPGFEKLGGISIPGQSSGPTLDFAPRLPTMTRPVLERALVEGKLDLLGISTSIPMGANSEAAASLATVTVARIGEGWSFTSSKSSEQGCGAKILDPITAPSEFLTSGQYLVMWNCDLEKGGASHASAVPLIVEVKGGEVKIVGVPDTRVFLDSGKVQIVSFVGLTPVQNRIWHSAAVGGGTGGEKVSAIESQTKDPAAAVVMVVLGDLVFPMEAQAQQLERQIIPLLPQIPGMPAPKSK